MTNRNDNIQNQYLKINQLPNEGYLNTDKSRLEKMIINDTIIAANDSLAMYNNGSTAKPGTIPHDIALKILDLVQRVSNPNAVDRQMFRGAANREKDVLSMTSKLFGKTENDNPDAGYLLSGGTESLNQVTYMLRNKYFEEELGENVRVKGIARAIVNATTKRAIKTGNTNLVTPRILLPVNYHFCGIKGSDLLGLGTESLAYYGLDKNFDVDEVSLRNKVEEIYNSGEDIIYCLSVAGDTTHGKVHDVKKISDIISEVSAKYGKKSPSIIVDAAGSYMFLGVMQDNPKYDGKFPKVSFKIPGIEAIVGDPHKQPTPYSSGMLILKNMELAQYADMRRISNPQYLDMDDIETKDVSAALATIPTSRSGANAFAIWAYNVYQGMSGLRYEKERIWDLVKDFKEYVQNNSKLDLVCEPQTQVVSFRYKGSGQDNIEIYKRIKNSSKDSCYISKDEGMLIRTETEKNSVDKGNMDYAGLFITIMEHNNQEHLNTLKNRIDEVITEIEKSR